MDLEQLSYLTDDQKERYVDLERTFSTKGWSVVEAFALHLAEEHYKRAATAPTWEDHRVATGARMAFEQIAALRNSTEQEFLAFAEQNMLNAVVEEEEAFE